MRTLKELVSNVDELTDAKLSKTGWKRRKSGVFTVDLNGEVVGWLGLNTAYYRNGVAINPVIGVRDQKLERLVAESLDMKPHQYLPATFGTNVGYLTPQKKYAAWSFQEGKDCEDLVTQMAAIVEKFGRP